MTETSQWDVTPGPLRESQRKSLFLLVQLSWDASLERAVAILLEQEASVKKEEL